MKKIIPIFILIMMLTACSKEEPQEPEPDVFVTGAINEVDSSHANRNQSTPTPTPFNLPTVTPLPEYVVVDGVKQYTKYQYNVATDPNKDVITDINTLSIDGKLIELPCSYASLLKTFEVFTKIDTSHGSVYNPVDTTLESTKQEVYAIPTTGLGTILFVFYSEDGNKTTIDKMTCKQIKLTSGSYTDETLMAVTLPKGITFGSTRGDIIACYGNPSTSNKSKTAFDLEYKPSSNKCKYNFLGSNGGLYHIDIQYFR